MLLKGQDILDIAGKNRKSSEKQVLPKTRARKGLLKSEPNIDSDTAILKSLITAIDCEKTFKNYDRLDNTFTKLRHQGTLTAIPLDLLTDFVQKIQVIIARQSALEFSKNYLKEAKKLSTVLEPSRVYLNLVGSPNTDQRLLIDEVLESILKLIKNSLEKLIIPMCSHSTKEMQKLLENAKVKLCMTSLCGVLEYLNSLIAKKCFQEHWLISISELLIKTLFSEGAELLHLTCCYSLASIIGAYGKIALQVLDEIINNLLTLTSDPNSAIGSKSKKIHCKDYTVAEGIEIKFSSFMLVYVIQSYSSLKNSVQCDGEVDLKSADNQLQETLGLSQHFVNEICDRCLKTRSESNEYRVFLEIFIQDLLKIIFRPEFPMAYHLINLFAIRFFYSLKTYSAVNRHFLIEVLSTIATSLKSSIHEVKKCPIVPQHITKVPLTNHPSEINMASMCICNEGYKEQEMVQCEECWKWFHLDCIGLDLNKYTDKNWYCDDCMLFECLQHIEIMKPAIKENEILALPLEIILVNQQYRNVYRELIANYLISTGGRMDDCARSIWLSSWFQENNSANIEKLWQTPPKTPNLAKLSEKGTIKLVRQYLLAFELGLTFLHIQHRMLNLLTAAQPLTRAKAIKAITAIVNADPDCLSEDMIESAVTGRLLDSSIAVREATIDLLGKFITYKSEFSDNYYAALLERLKDKGPSVRKRVIKILRDIIGCNRDHERIIEIYCEVVKRIGDSTEGIRDAVSNLFEEAWFNEKPQKFFMSIVKVLRVLKAKEPIVLLFKSVIEKNPEKYLEQLGKLAQISTEQLIASSSMATSILYAKILEIVSLTAPQLLVDQISTLHQFLTPGQNSTDEAELLTSICILIGRAAEHLSILNLAKVKRIEIQLLNLVFTQGSVVLTQALCALCKIVKLCSRNQTIITNLISKCFTLLSTCAQMKEIDKKTIPSLYRAMLALGLCIKFYDSEIFETFQVEENIHFKVSIFNCFEKYGKNSDENLKERALEALSLTWVRFPELLRKSDELIMNGWTLAKSPSSQIKILQMFYEFLSHCDKKLIEGSDEDHGNVLSIIQGYLDNIVSCAWSTCQEVRESSAEVLKLIFLQGQVNVSRMVSILLCMLGDENNIVKESAFFCIEKTFHKNPDLVAIKLSNSIREMFEYQKKLFKQRTLSESFYPKLYSLVKGKKLLRTKFLNQITELFESAEPAFTEFLCELFTIFSYSNYEELYPILKFLTGKIQTSAFRLLRIIKVRVAHKEMLNKENLHECLLQIQMILLKNYLCKTYQLKNIDEAQEKTLQKIENIEEFGEEYEEFKEYHFVEGLRDEELKKFRKKVSAI